MTHKVKIKDFHVDLEVKNKGVEFEIRIDSQHQGDLVVSKTGLEWCKGRTAVGNGQKVVWKDFIEWLESR